jgi:type I restriction enzyme M protein
VAEISDAKNAYNLNLPRYIDSAEPEDLQDIEGHLRGGIPNRDVTALARYWQVIPGVRAALFQPADRPSYSQLRVAAPDIKAAIFGHAEFTTFNASAAKLFAKWRAANNQRLKSFAKDGHPKALIHTIAEDLLVTFEKAPLLDPYDIYQHLMDYWAESMQDDCYLIASDGWRHAAQPRHLVDDKTKKNKVKPDFTVGKKKYLAELIPPALVIARWYTTERAEIDTIEAESAALQQHMDGLAEEHGGEGGLLEDAKNDKDKLTKASVAARLKEIKSDAEAADEHEVLQDYLRLIEQETAVSATLKASQDVLWKKVAAKYGQLTEDEIKTLVVDDKWLSTLAAAVQGELDRVSQTLTGRIRQLAKRYGTPLPQIADEVATLAARLDEHLNRMGASWK